MAAHLIWRRSEQLSGLRPFNLRRDLPAVVDLVLLAFAGEPERPGASQEELRLLKHFAPFIWVSSLLSDHAYGFFCGFVWEEGGKVVGNASVSKVGRDRSLWIVGNVAVHPDFRRRGIARQLTQAAIAYARDQGGRFVLLDVRADNKSAYDLYSGLGFERLGGTTDLKLSGWNEASAEACRSCSTEENAQVSLRFQNLGHLQWRPVYELELAARPAAAQEFTPVRQSQYKTGSVSSAFKSFSHLLFRRKDYRLLALDGERHTACLEVSVRGVKLSHRLRTIVHPDYRGKVEPALVSRAMDILRYHPWNSIWAEVSCDHTEQLEALKKCGFRETVTLHRLGLRLH